MIGGHDVYAWSIVAGFLLVAGLVTWTFGRFAGRRIARRRPTAARWGTCVLVPVLMIVVGWILFRIEEAAHPASDGPIMAFTGMIMLAGLSFLATIPVTLLVLGRDDGRWKRDAVDVDGEGKGRS